MALVQQLLTVDQSLATASAAALRSAPPGVQAAVLTLSSGLAQVLAAARSGTARCAAGCSRAGCCARGGGAEGGEGGGAGGGGPAAGGDVAGGHALDGTAVVKLEVYDPEAKALCKLPLHLLHDYWYTGEVYGDRGAFLEGACSPPLFWYYEPRKKLAWCRGAFLFSTAP